MLPARFLRGINGTDEILSDGTPQIALIGRSNVGKSSILNSLADRNDLARTSATPGLTQEINAYSFADTFYVLDLPGYGFAKVPEKVREHLQKLNWWYLFDSPYKQKWTVLIVDANVGPSANDQEMFKILQEHQKNILIVANKIDKIKKSDYDARLQAIEDFGRGALVIPYSAKEKIGVDALAKKLFG